jgi:hypothetical protein
MTTPTCPGCGAKFSHDKQKLICIKCGIPDQVIGRGSQAIKRWQKGKLPGPLREVAELKDGRVRIKSSATRKRRKHGRRNAVSMSKRTR